MRMKKRLSALVAAIMLLCSATMTAYAAHPVPDWTNDGACSIKVTMRYGETAVSGGTLTLYRVGEVKNRDEDGKGNYSFVRTGGFSDCGEDLNDFEKVSDLAGKLAAYVDKHDCEGRTESINAEGEVTFNNLEFGLYLLVQKTPASGYYAVSPFLVSVPMLIYDEDPEEGEYVYEVDASPKVEGIKKVPEVPEDPEKPDEPFNPDEPSEPVTPVVPVKTTTPAVPVVPILPVSETSTNTLPQTGQLNWPVPVLVVFGLGLFSAGWMLRYGKKKDENAK